MVPRRMVVRISSLAGALAVLSSAVSAADMEGYRKAPQQPPSQATGYVELYTGWSRATVDSFFCNISPPCNAPLHARVDGWALGGAGRATYWWAPNASVQLDVQGEGTSYRASGSTSSWHFSTHSYLVGGHASWRDPQRGLLGIFGAAGDGTTNFGTDSNRHGLIGLEGQVYWNLVTLYGQVGYDSTIGNPEGAVDSVHAWFVRGTARLYANPNLRFEGTVLYANGEFDYGPAALGAWQKFDTWLWRGKAEHKFGTAPFSMFVAYEGSRTSADFRIPSGVGSTRYADHRIMGGIRLYLGENTLQWNDNRGTTLDIIAPFGVPSQVFAGNVIF